MTIETIWVSTIRAIIARLPPYNVLLNKYFRLRKTSVEETACLCCHGALVPEVMMIAGASFPSSFPLSFLIIETVPGRLGWFRKGSIDSLPARIDEYLLRTNGTGHDCSTGITQYARRGGFATSHCCVRRILTHICDTLDARMTDSALRNNWLYWGWKGPISKQ